jgi:hypothetical protein
MAENKYEPATDADFDNFVKVWKLLYICVILRTGSLFLILVHLHHKNIAILLVLLDFNDNNSHLLQQCDSTENWIVAHDKDGVKVWYQKVIFTTSPLISASTKSSTLYFYLTEL